MHLSCIHYLGGINNVWLLIKVKKKKKGLCYSPVVPWKYVVVLPKTPFTPKSPVVYGKSDVLQKQWEYKNSQLSAMVMSRAQSSGKIQ